MKSLSSLRRENDLVREVAELSEQNIYACYQCGKCTAACPLTFAMDAGPHQILRFLQLGQVETVMNSKSPWACIGCLSCITYCPKGVDLARVMEALRTIHQRRLQAPVDYTQEDGERLSTLPQSAVVAAMRKVTS
jgi:heterodisulfide reductase subunit C